MPGEVEDAFVDQQGQGRIVGDAAVIVETVRRNFRLLLSFGCAVTHLIILHRQEAIPKNRPGSNAERSVPLALPSRIKPAMASPLAGAFKMPQTLCPVVI